MIFAHPVWLAAAAVAVALVWLLHRRRDARTARPVAAAFLWDRVADGAAAQMGAPRDPCWWLRAILAALILTAVAGPAWVAMRPGSVTVWVDNSASLGARDGTMRRADALADRLAATLAKAGPGAIELRSLRAPGRRLALDRADAARIRAWIAPSSDAPAVVARPSPRAANWLATDGADGRIAQIRDRLRPDRVIQAGNETENVSVTALAVRRALDDAGAFDGFAEIANGGRETAHRRLDIRRGDGTALFHFDVAIGPGATVQTPFRIRRMPRILFARIAPADALAEDDTLALSLRTVAPVAVGLQGACGAPLRAALAAHPGVRVLHGDGATGLMIACGPTPPEGAALWFRMAGESATLPVPPVWHARAGPLRDIPFARETWRAVHDPNPAGEVLLSAGRWPLIRQDGDRVVVDIDLESSFMVGSAAFPALLAGLIDRAAGRPVLELARPCKPAGRSGAHRAALSARSGSGRRAGAQDDATGAAPAPRGPGAPRARHRAPHASAGMRAATGWVVGRLGVAALLGLAATSPAPRLARAPIDLLVLQDAASDRAPEWQAARPVPVRGLEAGDRIAVVKYGGRASRISGPVPFDSPAASTLLSGGGGTAVALPGATGPAAAVRIALGLDVTGRQTVLALAGLRAVDPVLVRALREARERGVATLLLRPPAAGTRLAAVHVPARVPPGAKLPLTIEVAGTTAPVPVAVDFDGTRLGTFSIGRIGRIDVPAATPGLHEITARLADGDGRSRHATFDVVSGPRILVVARDGTSGFATLLSRAGGNVLGVPPSAFGDASAADVIVLDDIAIGDMNDAAWRRLEKAVRSDGTGLLVLGGPHAFAAGGYRGSRLESLLPVTIEAPKPARDTALMFVVDKSGSMGEPHAGAVPFAFARRAVMQSVATLSPRDAAGLLWFDREPVPGLPLARRAQSAQAIADAWSVLPNGGTAIVPALRQAVDALARWPAGRRVLVVISDGGIDGKEPVGTLVPRFATARIDAIVVLVGAEAEAGPLAALVANKGSLLLRADDIPALPVLLSTALATRRSPVAGDAVTPIVRTALPLLSGTPAWPSVAAHWVTRARDTSTVYLTAPDDAPLLVARRAGAGVVAALPAGFGAWTPAWLGWADMPGIAEALARFLSPTAADIVPDVRATPGGFRLAADVADREGWAPPTEGEALVTGPDDVAMRAAIRQVLPGRYEADIAAERPGRYGFVLHFGDRSARTAAYLEPSAATPDAGAALVAAGLATEAPSGSDALAKLRRFDRPVPLAAPLSALAALLYLILLAAERRRGMR